MLIRYFITNSQLRPHKFHQLWNEVVSSAVCNCLEKLTATFRSKKSSIFTKRRIGTWWEETHLVVNWTWRCACISKPVMDLRQDDALTRSLRRLSHIAHAQFFSQLGWLHLLWLIRETFKRAENHWTLRASVFIPCERWNIPHLREFWTAIDFRTH